MSPAAVLVQSVNTPGGGRIGMVACPGALGCLHQDIAKLKSWGACGLVSLVEPHELEPLKMSELGEAAQDAGLWWRHLPIVDRGIPDKIFEKCWLLEGPRVRRLLGEGESVVFHCWAGLGRSGMITARVLIEMGCETSEAIRQVREARPGAIETVAQWAVLQRLVSERSLRG